jgi:hypothetical protein
MQVRIHAVDYVLKFCIHAFFLYGAAFLAYVIVAKGPRMKTLMSYMVALVLKSTPKIKNVPHLATIFIYSQ